MSMGLNLQGVDVFLKWVWPALEGHEALFCLAMFEKAMGLALDLSKEDWKPHAPGPEEREADS